MNFSVTVVTILMNVYKISVFQCKAAEDPLRWKFFPVRLNLDNLDSFPKIERSGFIHLGKICIAFG